MGHTQSVNQWSPARGDAFEDAPPGVVSVPKLLLKRSNLTKMIGFRCFKY